MANELTVRGENELIDAATLRVDEKDLPTAIQDQIEKLNELSKSVAKAVQAADKATNSAKKARGMSAGLFKKKAAIEELQSAGVDLADAVASEAEAQKISFEFQKKLAEFSKFLLALGISNIANNRTIVRQLELKLKGASKGKLSELVSQEIMNVVRQLKEREDILSKQAHHSKIAQEHDKELKVLSLKGKQRDEELKAHAEKVANHDKKVKALSLKDKRRDEQLKAYEAVEKRHDKELHTRAKKDKEQDALLESLQRASQEMGERIEAQKIEIERLDDEVKNLNLLLAGKSEKLLPLVSLIVAVTALAGGVVLYLMGG
ncbi:hypothetical protein FACS1894110_24130 [Spirochaetia bacterium]|nr:hypothetical protein FACS1894110_24130 [Spirochaetia bacterium]